MGKKCGEKAFTNVQHTNLLTERWQNCWQNKFENELILAHCTFVWKKQLTELQIPRYKYNIIEDLRDDHAHIYKHCIQSEFDDNYLVTITKK